MLGQIAAVIIALLLGVVAIAIALLAGLRAKSPLALKTNRRFQRAIVNPIRMRSAGTRGASVSVIRHRGRASGREYETPIIAVPIDDGFAIALRSGSTASWVKNVLASGSAAMVYDAHTYVVDRPEVIPLHEVATRFSPSDQRGFRLLRLDECLRVHKAEPDQIA
jgi:hypothetical protein